jgi:hypothetical protein
MMSRRMKFATVLGVLLMSVAATAAQAQSFREAMAHAALTNTPSGGLPTSPLAPSTLTSTAWAVRYSHVSSPGNGNNVALTWYKPAGEGRVSLTGGTTVCDGCASRLMVGADWLAPMTTGELSAGLRPAVGLAKVSDDANTYYYSASLSMPVSWVEGGRGTRFIPFIEPGVGYGAVSSTGLSESATRMMTSGGLMISAADAPLSVVLSAQKVFTRNATAMYGIGVTFGGK